MELMFLAHIMVGWGYSSTEVLILSVRVLPFQAH